MQLALELYFDDYEEYPEDGCPPATPGCGCVSFDGMVENELISGGYISVLPEDPLHPNPCYQYQKDYIDLGANLCGGVALTLPNYVLLFRGETDISHEYPEWGNGSGYRCVSP